MMLCPMLHIVLCQRTTWTSWDCEILGGKGSLAVEKVAWEVLDSSLTPDLRVETWQELAGETLGDFQVQTGLD